MGIKVASGLLITILVTIVAAEKIRYENYKVMRVTPRSNEQLKQLQYLAENHMGYSFWNEPSTLGKYVDVMVAPHLQTDFNDMSSLLNLETEVFIDNVQEGIDNERPTTRKASEQRIGWSDYYTLEEVCCIS